MNASQAILCATRMIEFARHVPISKLARRAELSLRRRIGGSVLAPQHMDVPIPNRAAAAPSPIFTPSTQFAPAPRKNGLAFIFLNRTVEMPEAAVNWSLPSPDEEDQLWRMNLHYMEYLEGVREDLFARLVNDWMNANSPPSLDAWKVSWNSYALAIRVVVWLQQLVRRAGRLEDAFVRRVEASAFEQLRFLERNLETDIGGNHLIKNIKALIWASAFFRGEEAHRWRQKGLHLLLRELSKQILADGMHYERSASYHAQVFSDLLECRHALGTDPFEGALDNALHRMAQATADLVHPDGFPVLFNDSGLNMAYRPKECLDVFERLFGQRPQPRRNFALRASGYYGFRCPEFFFVADCGPIAPDDLPAHGHGDVLSFELSVHGKRMIVDQGVFEYIAGDKRQLSRSASAHNTLCFDRANQADFFGAFRCGRRPNVAVLTYEPRPDGLVLEGTHDGFCNLHGKPRHIRRFKVTADRIVIHDRVEGATNHPAHISFLLSPDSAACTEGNAVMVRQADTLLKIIATVPIRIEPAVWWPNMGAERRTSRLILRQTPPTKTVTTDVFIDEKSP